MNTTSIKADLLIDHEKTSSNWPLLITVALICIALVGFSAGTEYGIGLIGIAAAFGLAILVGFRNPVFFFPIVAGAGLRSVFALIQAWLVVLPDGARDALRFHKDGIDAAAIPLGAWLTSFPEGSFIYSHLLGLLYKPLGPSVLLGLSINVLLGVIIISLLGSSAQRLWGQKIGIRTAWIAALFPTLVLFSAVLLRENLILVGLAVAIFSLIASVQRASLVYAIVAMSAIYFAGSFNKGVWAALPVPALLFTWLLIKKLETWIGIDSQKAVRVASVIVLAIAGAFAVYMGLVISGLTEMSFERFSYLLEARTAGRTSYPDYLVPGQPIDLLWAFPARLLFFLLTPFPWMLTSLIDLFGLVDMLLYVGVFIGLWTSRRHLKSETAVVWIALLAVAVLFAFALVTSNVGTAVRHRTKILPMLLLLVPLLPLYHKMDRVIEAVETRMERIGFRGKQKEEPVET